MGKETQLPAKFYSVRDVVEEFFPSMSSRWVKETFGPGAYGAVIRTAGCWMVSEAAIVEFQRRSMVDNLVVVERFAGDSAA